MRIIDQLVYKITGDSTSFDKSISGTEKNVTKFSKVATMALTALSVGAIAGVSKKLLQLAEDSATTLDRVDKMSQKIGLSREAFQEWDFILSQSGASVDGLQMSLKTLSNASAEAKDGTAEYKDEFDRLGITVTDTNGNLKDSETLFNETFEALADMKDETQRTATASKLLGRSATELAPAMNTSSDAIEDMRTQAHELGLVMSDDVVDAGVKLTDSLDQLRRSFKGLKTQATEPLLIGLNNVIQKMIGQKSASDDLVTATDDIIGISTDYNTILKKLNGNLSDQETLELSLAKIRNEASLQKAFDEFADGYQSVEKLKESFTGVGGSITLAQENVDSFTQQLKAWAQDNQIEFDPDISFKDLYAKMDEAVPSPHLESLWQGYLKSYDKLTNATSEYDAIVKKQTLSIGELSSAVVNGSLNIDSLQFSNKELYDLISDGVSTIEKEVDSANKLVSVYEIEENVSDKRIAQMVETLKFNQKLATTEEAKAIYQEKINELLKETTEATKESTEATKKNTDAIEDGKNAVDRFNEATKTRADAYKELNSYYQSDKEAFISNLQEQGDAWIKAGVDRADVAKWASDQLTDYAQQQADEEKAIADSKRDMWIGYGEDIAGSIGSTWGYINDIQENQNDKELTRLQGLVDATEEGSEARETAEQNLLDAKNEFAKEEAKRDKAQASFNAVIDTASAVIGLLANPGGLLGVGLSAGAIATGAAQLGAINSAEVPSYAVGTIDVPYDGLKQLHQGEGVMTKGIMDEAKTQGITIEPKNKSNSSSGMTQVNVYLGSKLISSEIVKDINSGSAGKINSRVVK